jgi:hypothetical protein
MMMGVEQSVECLAGETEALPQSCFVHHKSQMSWYGLEPFRRGGKPATNRLSYDTATHFCCKLRRSQGRGGKE